ncbi:hypothetical protein MHTCC0001_20960 [Flavobacteriaceae bacterium MHTCC 0001]
MKYFTFLILLFLLLINYSFTQNDTTNAEYYKLYDAYLLPKNLGILNGREYLDIFPESILGAKTNNKFYGSFDFLRGYVLYDGQPYYNIKLKYELIHDLLLLPFVHERMNFLSLNPEMVDEFILKGSKFKRLPKVLELNSIYGNGFFKEEYEGKEFFLYVKYVKKAVEKIEGRSLKYDFRESRFYIIGHKNQYYQITSKKRLTEIFPSLRKAIKLFYRKNKTLKRNDKEQFYINLLKNLDYLGSRNEVK